MPHKKHWLKKAYRNLDFLTSPAARNIRILCEMVEPAHRLRINRVHNTVVFFGSARTLSLREAKKKYNAFKRRGGGKKASDTLEKLENDVTMARYYEEARQLAKKLTRWFNKPKNRAHHFYICSGGGPGIMEAASRGAKEAGGKSVGLNISLPMEQVPNDYQTEDISFEFHYFFIRKFWFFYLAKALVVFPGGFGTLDEFFELLTVIQTQKTKKHMPVVLYGSEYWNEVLDIEAMAKWGMISPEDLKLYHTFDTVDETLQFLKKELRKNYFK